MDELKRELLARVEADRDLLVGFLRDFIRIPSPNPPGDTREAAQHVLALLEARGIAHRVIAPEATMPNIVASFEGGRPGRHLALNGHIDVFPVEDTTGWTVDPWSAALVGGRIYGRGACDMKSGTTASLFAFLYLHEIRERLHGRVTLSLVSDEETFGPWGARFLADHHPEVFGDCCLNAEPSGRTTFRFGEKGPLWLRFTTRTHGAHGAYVHRSGSAIGIAARVIGELERLADLAPADFGNLTPILDAATETADAAWGTGAGRNLQRITVNPGIVRGGAKVNMVAAECVFEVDIRLPNGLDDAAVRREVDAIVAAHPEVTYEPILYNPPSWTAPDAEMAGYVQANALAVSGIEPIPVVSLGGTDARLWRYKDIPAIVFGPSPIEMGGVDEYVEVDEFLDVVRTHVLSAYDYLSRPHGPSDDPRPERTA